MTRYFHQLLTIDQYLLMIGFLVMVISIIHLVLLKVSEDKPQKFIRIFMIATMGKFVLYLVFILSIAFYYSQQATALLIAFLILYLCYTTLEVVYLRKHLDSQSR